jgi:hypothetical protein
MPGFEIYLQFDSLRPEPYAALRGRDLLEIKLKALKRLNAARLSTTLVMTLKRGLNDHEIGDVVRFALEQPCVRGVTLQPIQDAGRNTDGARSPDVGRGAHPLARAARRVRSARCHPRALSPRLPGDGLCAEARRASGTALGSHGSAGVAARRTQHDRVRAQRQRAPALAAVVFDSRVPELGRGHHRSAAVLPTANAARLRSQLSQRVSRAVREVHGCARLRRAERKRARSAVTMRWRSRCSRAVPLLSLAVRASAIECD